MVRLFVKSVVACFVCILSIDRIEAAYDYLGCYTDSATNRDLSKSEITFPVNALTVSECVNECVLSGWPYVGLQEGKKCFCGTSYGKHGVAVNIDCNYTCNGDTEWCGGKTANSVYYTVRTDTASKSARSLAAYTTPKSYESARQDCVSNNGDLAIAKTVAEIDELVDLFTNAELNANQRKIWFGLRRRPQPNGNFEWTDPTETFNLTGVESFWQTGESWQNACVQIDMDTGKWETTSCVAEYPYVCFQSGADTSNPDYPDGDSADTIDEEEESGTNTLALAIVLPIFALCYGGSCLLYCIHKLYRNCKRRKKGLLDKEEREATFSEFEPETKPSLMSQPPPSYNPTPALIQRKQSASLEKGHSNPAMDNDDDPAEESQPEPSRPGSALSARQTGSIKRWGHATTAASGGPVISSRPTTCESVQIRVDETAEYSPPGSTQTINEPPVQVTNESVTQFEEFEKQAKKLRAEKRRTHLLQNALKEARERRARESSGGSLSSRSLRPKGFSPTPSEPSEDIPHPNEVNTPPALVPSRPKSSGKKASPSPSNDYARSNSESAVWNSDVETPHPYPSPKKAFGGNDSGSDSVSSLMNDDRSVENSSPDDPTKMSISDIIKVKMMMKEKKKRVKKILTC